MITPQAKCLETFHFVVGSIKEARLVVHDVFCTSIYIHLHHQLATGLGAFEDEVSSIGGQRSISCLVDQEFVVLVCKEGNNRNFTRNGVFYISH